MERRKEGISTRDIAIETQAMLEAHTQKDEDHFAVIKETISTIDTKIDKLNRNQMFAAGALAALMVLMNYPQLIRAIQPNQAQASQAAEGR